MPYDDLEIDTVNWKVLLADQRRHNSINRDCRWTTLNVSQTLVPTYPVHNGLIDN